MDCWRISAMLVGVKAISKVIAEYGPMSQGPLPKGIADAFRTLFWRESARQALSL